MQGSDEVGAIGPVVQSAVESLAGPEKPKGSTQNPGSSGVSGGVAQVATNSGASASTGADVLALSSGLTAASAQTQAERAAQLLKIVGNGAAQVDVSRLARVLDREGVILP